MKGSLAFRAGILRGALVAVLLAGLLPAAASAACAGKLSMLQPYAGQYLADHGLLDAPALAATLARLPGNERLHLKRNLDVSGPIALAGCHLVLAGNAPHMGTEQDAMLDVDLASGTVIAAIHAGGRIDIYVLADANASRPDWNALPRALREWAVRADMGFPQQPPRNLAEPRSVRLHAVPPGTRTASAAPRATGKPLRINFDKDAIKPTPAQNAAIRHAAASDIADFNHPQKDGWDMAQADLNGDGRPDLLVQYTDGAFCGSAGCSGVIILATAHGYASKAIDDLPNFYGEITVLASEHHGMRDLQFGDSPIWIWNGKDYAIPRADLPKSNAERWKTAQAPGRPLMAVATPVDSRIKNLLVFCEQGTPLLAIVTKMPLSTGQVTLTFVFRGWTVNVPMQRNTYNQSLWVANLSRSDLPEWLAHRGSNATTRSLAQLATESYLRINGATEGEISLENSTAATRAALAGCYRY
ncbi:MAG: hypothetical protein EPN38_11370 [Rhodanobacteraceae bacterium]|nr:MAG: hypothetical protein EPN38_11370 [Rhodanobacteraceae bacterium]